MMFWTEQSSLSNPDWSELCETIASENIDDGWIAQLESSDRNYLHSMAFQRPNGDLGFYLELRGPEPDQWFEGIPPNREKVVLTRPWWQFWGKDLAVHLFEKSEMLEAFSQFLEGEAQPRVAYWSEIPPSYKD
ncbi:MAG: hypothetical protein ABJK59_03520 [Erythrobacter sp.]|uniref:hypothetical protein n=1 Tax=Erythrobacter sp. TaxID=1042 RepID=UPI0032979A71